MTSARTHRPAEAILAIYGSWLRRPVVGWLVGAVLLAAVGYALFDHSGLLRLPSADPLRVLGMTLAVTGAISLLPVLVLRWLDRREPEPWFMYALAFFWGGLIASGISQDLNQRTPALLGMLATPIGTPLVEEGSKALGLLLLLLALRSEFDGPRDGIIYGALVGLGFNWFETAVFLTNGYVQTGSIPWASQLSSRYGLLGLSGHALYTAITGMFIGLSLLQPGRWRRVWLPLAGLALAIGCHMLWDTLGVLLTGVLRAGAVYIFLGQAGAEAAARDLNSIPWWLTVPANILGELLGNLPGFLIIAYGLRRSERWERGVMAEQLKAEVDGQVVTPAEYSNIVGPCEPPRRSVARRIFAAQCNLAKRTFFLEQHTQPVDGDPLVAAWRGEVLRLRPANDER